MPLPDPASSGACAPGAADAAEGAGALQPGQALQHQAGLDAQGLGQRRVGLAHQGQAVFEYDHPGFDLAAVAAQRRVPELQGRTHVWYCGAWTRYGFHEDGLASGLAVVAGLRAQWAREAERPRPLAA